MGYVIIQGQNGEPDRVLGLDTEPHEQIMLCDCCNEPRSTSDGMTIHNTGLDLMWLCNKCNFRNYG